MKNALLFLFLCLALTVGVGAQTPVFDPQRDPIGLRSSDSTFQLLVSEYLLAKAISARVGRGCQIQKITKTGSPANQPALLFAGCCTTGGGASFTISVPLVADPQQRFFYAGQQALVCQKPGCSSCTIENGVCKGCCSNHADATAPPAIFIAMPLLKVSASID